MFQEVSLLLPCLSLIFTISDSTVERCNLSKLGRSLVGLERLSVSFSLSEDFDYKETWMYMCLYLGVCVWGKQGVIGDVKGSNSVLFS